MYRVLYVMLGLLAFGLIVSTTVEAQSPVEQLGFNPALKIPHRFRAEEGVDLNAVEPARLVPARGRGEDHHMLAWFVIDHEAWAHIRKAFAPGELNSLERATIKNDIGADDGIEERVDVNYSSIRENGIADDGIIQRTGCGYQTEAGRNVTFIEPGKLFSVFSVAQTHGQVELIRRRPCHIAKCGIGFVVIEIDHVFAPRKVEHRKADAV